MIYTVTFNPSLDYIVSVPEFKPGRTNRTQEEILTAGGKGINVSLVLTALGVPNTALGFTAGFVGEEIRRQLREREICCDFLTLPEGCSRINVKLKNLEGTEINGKGPSIDEASLSILKGKIAHLSDRDILVLSGSIPSGMSKKLYAELMELLPERVKVVVDAAGETLLHTLPQHPFLIKPNRDELEELLPESPSGNLKHCALRLQQLGARNVLISMAGDGAALQRFPSEYAPYWGNVNPEDYKYDKAIYALAVKKARDYIEANKNDDSDVKKVQVAVLRYLLFYVSCVNSTQYVYSDELIRNAQNFVDRKVTRDFLFRQVIAPLRDSGVILASCVHGYKIPISVEDINTYLNQTTSIVGPMMQRMGKCRQLIKEGTSNDVDVFNDPAFLKYKRYFDD